jgi:hypothetical protein
LDESPFGQYETWVKLSQLKTDTRDNLIDQPFPTQQEASQLTVLPPPPDAPAKKRARRSPSLDTKRQAAITKLNKNKTQVQSTHPPIVFAVNVSYTNMFKASGQRRGFRGQQQVMGASATTVRILDQEVLSQLPLITANEILVRHKVPLGAADFRLF